MIRSVEEFVGASIPEDAKDLEFDAEFGQLFYIQLRFSASPPHVERFIQNICEGILFAGYNPFQAFSTLEPRPGAHLITFYDGAYYSYSPSASKLLFGNRCASQSAMQNILVDKTDPNLYEFRYETTFHWNPDPLDPSYALNNSLPAAQQLYINPTEQLPFMILGMVEFNGKYELVTEKTCVEVGPTLNEQPNFIIGSRFEYLANAKVKVYIDNEQVASTYITDVAHGWQLASLQSTPDRERFNYCFVREWTAGKHSMAVEVATVDGKHLSHAWNFWVQEDFSF